jgi:hypothetical protein
MRLYSLCYNSSSCSDEDQARGKLQIRVEFGKSFERTDVCHAEVPRDRSRSRRRYAFLQRPGDNDDKSRSCRNKIIDRSNHRSVFKNGSADARTPEAISTITAVTHVTPSRELNIYAPHSCRTTVRCRQARCVMSARDAQGPRARSRPRDGRTRAASIHTSKQRKSVTDTASRLKKLSSRCEAG